MVRILLLLVWYHVHEQYFGEVQGIDWLHDANAVVIVGSSLRYCSPSVESMPRTMAIYGYFPWRGGGMWIDAR